MSETVIEAMAVDEPGSKVDTDRLSGLQRKHEELASYVSSNFADMERRFQGAIQEGPAYKALVAAIEELKKGQGKQGDDHKKLWEWVKKIELRLIRRERGEEPAKAAEGEGE